MQNRKPKPKESITTVVGSRTIKVAKRASVKSAASKLKKKYAAAFAYLKDK
jgi:hypothetical protein